MAGDELPRIGVVVHGGKQLAGAGPDALRDALADAGHVDPPWYEVSKSKKAPSQVRELIEEHGVDRLLVWGGDGTVRRCADTILHHAHRHQGYRDVAIGVLPAGTGNVLAATLGIARDLHTALDTALDGEPRPIDAGLVNDEEHFLARAGTGFDALLVRDADDSGLKDRFGRLGYLWAGIRNRHVTPSDAQITVDGEPWFSGPTPCVIAGNVGALLGGLTAFPDASPTDGRLDVGVVEATTPWEWARLAASVFAHRVHESRLARTTTADTVVVQFDRPVPWQVDGGDRERTDRFEIRCLPAAVSICRPRTTQQSISRG